MYQDLAVFRTAVQMAKYAGSRQAMTAQNVANADTPGYRAKHMPTFAEAISKTSASVPRTTRDTHLTANPARLSERVTMTTAEPSPNGNAVSIEEEMMNSVQIAREHNRALTVYRHAMTIIRSSLGR